MQQHEQRRIGDHKERAAVAPAEVGQCTGEATVEQPRDDLAVGGLDRRARLVGNDLERLEAGELACHLFASAARFGRGDLPLPLPLDVVGIGALERRERRSLARHEPGTDLAHLAGEHADRPSVADGVVRGDQDHRNGRTHAHVRDAQQRRRGDVERAARLERGDPFRLGARGGLVDSGEVDQGNPKRHRGEDDLARLAVGGREIGAQRLVTRDDEPPGLLDVRVRDLALEPPAHGDVEAGVLGVELRLEPEALLRLRAGECGAVRIHDGERRLRVHERSLACSAGSSGGACPFGRSGDTPALW